MKNIEKLIQQKAEILLRKEIKEFAKTVTNQRLWEGLREVKVILPGKTEPETSSLTQLLDEYYTDKGLYQVLFEKWIEDYTNVVARDFFDKVERLK